MYERENQSVNNGKKANKGRSKARYLSVGIAIVFMVLLVLPSTVYSEEGAGSVAVNANNITYQDYSQFVSNHRTLISAIMMYCAMNNGAVPKSFNDLSAFFDDISGFLKTPQGATYSMTIKAGGELILTSTLGEYEAVFSSIYGNVPPKPYEGDLPDEYYEQAFKANHTTLVAAVFMYMADHNGVKPQNFDDLSPYVNNINNLLSSPEGATYTLAIDSSNVLTLTSTYKNTELIYSFN